MHNPHAFCQSRSSRAGQLRRMIWVLAFGLITVSAVEQVTASSHRPHGLSAVGPHYWWRFPSIATGQIEEAFLRTMSHHYGPHWLRWMPDEVIAEHWRRFPMHFGNGPEAAFKNWMNANFGAGWQHWVPAPVVHQSWCQFRGR